jgi:uncharacterized phage infection (PIP) family protein YhgE
MLGPVTLSLRDWLLVDLDDDVEELIREVDASEDRDRRQTRLLVAILAGQRRLEQKMTELSQAVADLQTAVQGVADRVGPTVQDLKDQLAAAAATAAEMAAADATEDANYDQTIADLQAQLAGQLAAATDAATTIEANVGQLNAIAAPEAPPV